MKVAKSLQNFKFRMNLRKTLIKEPTDFLIITKEEVIKELERRHKK